MKLPQALRAALDRLPAPGDDPARHIRPLTIAAGGLLAFQVVLAVLDLALPPDMGRAERSSPVALDRHGAWLRALPVENGRWRIRADLARRHCGARWTCVICC